MIKTKKRASILIATAVLALTLFGLSNVKQADAAPLTFTVNSTSDAGDSSLDGVCDAGSGNCTLRAAIEEANDNPGADTINFALGAGPYVFSLALDTPYDPITEAVTINGLSQAGSSASNILIEVDGTTAGSGSTYHGFSTAVSNVVYQGMHIHDFSGSAMASYTGSTDITIRNNLIHDNGGDGVALTDTNRVNIYGNTIYNNGGSGVGATGVSNMTVGSSSVSDRNVIYSNGAFANISLLNVGGTSADNIIQGNYIGANASGAIVADKTIGIFVHGDVLDTLIGGTQAGQGNLIIGNETAGVTQMEAIIDNATFLAPERIAIIGNTIHSTEAGTLLGSLPMPGLGIDNASLNYDGSFAPTGTEGEGPDANDASDVDTGPNHHMNYPVLNSVIQDGTNLTVNLNLDAADSTSGDYRVEFFANDTADTSGYGEGQTYLGYANLSNGAGKQASITLANGTDLTGKVLSATTTAINGTTDSGFGSTSEFSLVHDVNVIAPSIVDDGTTLINAGTNVVASILVGGTLITLSVVMARKRSTKIYSRR